MAACRAFESILGEQPWSANLDTGCSSERSKDRNTIKIVQTVFIDNLIERFNEQSTSPSPNTANVRLRPKTNEAPGGDWPFRQVVGCLMWLAT